ncbi:MAG: protein phosphatase 2C domain-containing protein [Longimicrobiales bacterium]
MPKEIRFSTETTQGRRQQNEDAVLAERFPEDGLLLAVADGMGGHAAGEVASALALETVLDEIRAGKSLEDAVRQANRQVHKTAQDPDRHGMGTTLTVVHVKDDRYLVANVGDSRAYRLSRRGIRQLTEDHSFVSEARKRGQPEGVGLTSPWKEALTRSIGTDEDVDVDIFGPFSAEDDTAVILCSDGLYKALERGEIWKIFMASKDLHEAARELTTTAFERGSDDNITVAIAEFGAFPRRRAEGGSRGATRSQAEERRGLQNLWPILDEEVETVGWEETGVGGTRAKGDPAEESKLGTRGAGDRGGDRTETGDRAKWGIGGRDTTSAGMEGNADDIRPASRRRAVGPLELGSHRRPKIVGGAEPKGTPWRWILLIAAAVAILGAATFILLR